MASVGNNDQRRPAKEIERPKPLAIPIGYTKAFQVTASALRSQPQSVTEHPGGHWDQRVHAVGGFAGVGGFRVYYNVVQATTRSECSDFNSWRVASRNGCDCHSNDLKWCRSTFFHLVGVSLNSTVQFTRPTR